VADQVANKQLNVQYHPGQENLADYTTKHHPAAHHIKVRPYYQHEDTSPRTLQRAPPPAALRGCVETQKGYAKGHSPLLGIQTSTAWSRRPAKP
jgi:hypothetical protein